MPALIMVNPGGAQDGVYVHAGGDDLVLFSVSANVTTVANDSAVEVTCVEQSGATIAHSRTKAQILSGNDGLVTFAPYLPDTAGLPGVTSDTVIQTGLALTPLQHGSRVTVHPIEADAKVTEARLWVVSPELLPGDAAFGITYLLPAGA